MKAALSSQKRGFAEAPTITFLHSQPQAFALEASPDFSTKYVLLLLTFSHFVLGFQLEKATSEGFGTRSDTSHCLPQQILDGVDTVLVQV